MPYVLAGEEFKTKQQLTERCREIIAATSDGADVTPEHLPFLFALFQHHDEWSEKSAGGVLRITTQTTDHGTRCFTLIRTNGSSIHISFPHSIKHIPTTRKQDLLPQKLLDYRNAARTAITVQVRTFRDQQVATTQQHCLITGQKLTRDNAAVDHVAPLTFDRLLYEFTLAHGINPLNAPVGSRNGTVAVFEDDELEIAWAEYHSDNAKLRLLSRAGHAQLSTERIDWSPILDRE